MTLQGLSTFIYTGVSLTVNVPYLQPKPRYKVISVNGTRHILAKITPSTKIVVNDQEEEEAEVNLQLQSIPGFSAQVKQINTFLTSLKYGLFPGNLVINGGRGSGKSFFLDAIANMQWHAVHRVDQTCTFSKIQDVLDGAKKTRQSALIIDDLDLILQNFKSQPSTLRVLMALLDKTLNVTAYEPMQKESHWPKLIIIASCADCFALPEQFQDRNRFAKAITLPVPDAEQRLEILQSLLASDASDGILRDVASRTYAYTPRDLGRLYDQVNIARADRLQDSGVSKFDPDHHRVEKQDVEHALSTSKPSGLRDINLRPPTVRWDDIGGQERIKAQLRAMVESIKVQSILGSFVLFLFSSLLGLTFVKSPQNPRPKVNRGKAALFYGPPGCAKTLFAQAMATEAGCNFFSVKGPELVSKYVGETERSLRALFTRARAYAPSIIFFDEIDSMGFRAEGGPSAASLRGAFLTEMDGFEHRGGVFVIAATNRPWDVDPALQRAGRFSFKVYMGLPDEPSRVAIARILARKLEVDQAELDYDKVARMTEGYSGADLEDMLVTEYEESGTLTMEGISEATACTEPSVSRDTLARFEEWEASKKKPQH